MGQGWAQFDVRNKMVEESKRVEQSSTHEKKIASSLECLKTLPLSV